MAKFVTLHTEEEVRAAALADVLWWRYVGVECANKESAEDAVRMWRSRNAGKHVWEHGVLVEDNNDNEENNE